MQVSAGEGDDAAVAEDWSKTYGKNSIRKGQCPFVPCFCFCFGFQTMVNLKIGKNRDNEL